MVCISSSNYNVAYWVDAWTLRINPPNMLEYQNTYCFRPIDHISNADILKREISVKHGDSKVISLKYILRKQEFITTADKERESRLGVGRK